MITFDQLLLDKALTASTTSAPWLLVTSTGYFRGPTRAFVSRVGVRKGDILLRTLQVSVG